jgi:hypothetical protein
LEWADFSVVGTQFNDNELMVMIISALGSGVRTMREVADLNRVTAKSLEWWVEKNGRPSWGQLKKLYPRTAPKEKKKRKAVPKTGEQQTKKKEPSGGAAIAGRLLVCGL